MARRYSKKARYPSEGVPRLCSERGNVGQSIISLSTVVPDAVAITVR